MFTTSLRAGTRRHNLSRRGHVSSGAASAALISDHPTHLFLLRSSIAPLSPKPPLPRCRMLHELSKVGHELSAGGGGGWRARGRLVARLSHRLFEHELSAGGGWCSRACGCLAVGRCVAWLTAVGNGVSFDTLTWSCGRPWVHGRPRTSYLEGPSWSARRLLFGGTTRPELDPIRPATVAYSRGVVGGVRGGAGAAAGDVQARATCCCGRRAAASDALLRATCCGCGADAARARRRERG